MLIPLASWPAGATRLSGPARLATALVLAALLWRASLLLLDPGGCGVPIPHDHILVGGAGPAHLAAHLASERACAQAARAAPLPAAESPGVLSINQIAVAQSGLLLALALVLLGGPDCALRRPAALAQARRLRAASGRSLAFPPPTPVPLPLRLSERPMRRCPLKQ